MLVIIRGYVNVYQRLKQGANPIPDDRCPQDPPAGLGPFCSREDVEAADDASSHHPSPPCEPRLVLGVLTPVVDMLVVDVGFI